MDKEYKNSQMGTLIKGCMRMESQKDTDNIIGGWEVFSKATLKMV